MIESACILVGSGILALVLVADVLATRPTHAPVTVRMRKVKW